LTAFKGARNSELVSIISGDKEKLEKVRRKFKVRETYSYDEYEQALADVDAVYIALPNHLHKEYTVRAARAGVHILCEKPMAPTEKECWEVITAAEQNGVKLMIAYRLHFEAGYLAAVRLVQDGKLGKVRFFSSEFALQVAEDNVRVRESVDQGGGPLYDLGVYCINAARYLFREDPVEVVAMTANNGEERFRKIEEMTSAVLRFPQERLATFTCSFGAADVSRYALVGTKGDLLVDPAYEYAEGIRHRLTIDGKTKTKEFPKRDQFVAELVYFSDCILQDKQPEPSGLEGLADVRVVEAIHKSAQIGKMVEIPKLRPKKRPTDQQEIHRPAHEKPKTVRTKSTSGQAA